MLRRKLEVDLWKLGIDLLDFYRGNLSLRRLVVFSLELGNNSLLMTEMGRRELGDQILWDHDTFIRAAQANTARELLYFHHMCRWVDGGKKGPEPTRPEPINPPGYTAPKPVMTPIEDVIAFLESRKG